MKKALIITYNGDDGETIDKPFQVMIDNASTAVRKQKEKWMHLTRNGVNVVVEYDIVSYEKRKVVLIPKEKSINHE